MDGEARDSMDVTDATASRFDEGIDQFLSGSTLCYFDVAFQLSGKSLLVHSYSKWLPENTTEALAKERILRAKNVLADLIARDDRVRNAIEEAQIEHWFCFDTGKAGIAMAKEVDGQFEWLHHS
jgi:hypothetical protein